MDTGQRNDTSVHPPKYPADSVCESRGGSVAPRRPSDGNIVALPAADAAGATGDALNHIGLFFPVPPAAMAGHCKAPRVEASFPLASVSRGALSQHLAFGGGYEPMVCRCDRMAVCLYRQFRASARSAALRRQQSQDVPGLSKLLEIR